MTDLRGNFKSNKNLSETCPLCGSMDTTEHVLECIKDEERTDERMDLKDSSTENLLKIRKVFKAALEARETKKETT